MIKRLVIAAVLSASAAIAAPVFASSGYGPAPHYDPLIGAPSSQRGQSAETVRARLAFGTARIEHLHRAVCTSLNASRLIDNLPARRDERAGFS
ncbi:MAG: hypothetical protein JF605_19195 [Burkholderia sp.]|nr:hypothetical protein [Burkholderia sp.]